MTIVSEMTITHSHPSLLRPNRPALPAVLALSALLLTACGAAPGGTSGQSPSEGADSAGTSTSATSGQPKESQAPAPRLVMTHDSGITVLDAKTLKAVGETPLEGFNRLSPAGDGRHVLVATGDSFRVFDAGVWTEAHGDHGHSYVAAPELTDRAFSASKSGHVVRHAGRTVLFSDGSGKVEVFDPATLTDALKSGLPATTAYTTPEAHHGVAVELADGRLLVTVGNEESRKGLALLSAPDGPGGERRELLRNEECPGVHGEAVAGEETVVVGCEDGMLVYKDGAITKVASPDPYGRMGNQAGSEASPVILGDYKVDKEAELERPTRISLVNTETGRLQLVELGASYSFRSLGRGPAGEALVLGTDGALHVIDPLTGNKTGSISVVPAWEEPTEWQDPRPTLFVQGAMAYVTDPAGSKIHAVDLKSGKVARSADLDRVPNELTGVTG